MAIQLKVQCLAIDAPTERSYNGRKWLERSLQCIAEQKVFVYRVFGEVGDSEQAKESQKALDEWKTGAYMADLDFRQGEGAKATFVLTNLIPVQKQTA